MQKSLVIKNTENKKYFTGGRYESGWSLDIEDARKYNDDSEIMGEIKTQTDDENTLYYFENVKYVVIETIYHK